MKRYALFAVTCLVSILAMTPLVGAASYDVSATVPAPIPSAPAVVESPGDNTAVTSQQTIISGTCPIVTPAVIVSIWRGDEMLGSGICSPQGTFSIVVTLVLGSNYLLAKVQTITGDYGVIGAPITVFYIPAGSGSGGSSTPQPSAPLSVQFAKNFFTFTPGKEFLLQFDITGGKAPYKVVVVWGDGDESAYTFEIPGTHSATHTYKSAARYSLEVRLYDAAGQTSKKAIAVTSLAIPADVDKRNVELKSTKNYAWILLVITVLVALACGVLVYRWRLLLTKKKRKNKDSMKRTGTKAKKTVTSKVRIKSVSRGKK